MQIIPTSLDELQSVFKLISECGQDMRTRGIHQWDETYPTIDLVRKDIEAGSMYSITQNDVLVGIIVMDEEQSPQYKTANWRYQEAPILVVHRLAIHPKYQGQGLGKIMMGYAEDFAQDQGYKSIRLDAYKHNPGTIGFYRSLGYEEAGEIPLEYTAGPFVCFEKQISED